jgi:hypothetical protein
LFFGYAGKPVGRIERFQLEIREAAFTENVEVFPQPAVSQTADLLQLGGDLSDAHALAASKRIGLILRSWKASQPITG